MFCCFVGMFSSQWQWLKSLFVKPDFFGAEQKSNPPGLELLANRGAGRFVEVAHGLLQCAIADRGRPHNQSAIGHSFGNSLEFFRRLEQVGGADS